NKNVSRIQERFTDTRTFHGYKNVSRVQPVQRSGERNRFPDVLQATNPRYRALDAHAETAMGDTTELAQIQIPLERFLRQAMLVNALQQQFIGCHTLRTTDDLAVTLRSEHIHT